MRSVALLLVSVLSCSTGLVLFYSPSASGAVEVALICVALLQVATYALAYWNFFNSVFQFGLVFTGLLALFHLTVPVLELFTTSGNGFFVKTLRPLELQKAMALAVVALGSIGIGGAIGFLRMRVRVSPTTPETVAATQHFVFRMSLGLLLAALVFFAMFVASAGNILQYARTDFYESTVAGRGLGAFIYVFPGALIGLAVGARTKSQRMFAGSMVGIAFPLILLSGYRSEALMPLLAGLVLWAKTGRNIHKPTLAIVLIAVVVSIPAIRILRNDTYNQISVSSAANAFEQGSILQAFAEVGATLGVLSSVVTLVPETVEYQMGSSYLLAVTNSIPNIGLRMSESPREKFLRLGHGRDRAVSDLAPSDWVTFYVAPDKFRSGQGVGFSAVAEPYANFGIAGVVVVFTVFGFLLLWLDRTPFLAHPWVFLLVSATTWSFLKVVRNDIANFVKTTVFVMVVLAIWYVFARGMLQLRRPRRPHVVPNEPT